MNESAVAAKNLRGLLKKIGKTETPDLPDMADPIAVLMLSFLLWESTTEKALTAYRRLRESIVDFNDLRVSMPRETVEVIGERYPRASERAQRLRAVLRDIYMREHEVTLDRATGLAKREARKYVESLEGMVPYVSARTLLMCFDTHAIPVDEQLRNELAKIGVADKETDTSELASWLSRQIKASNAQESHFALQQWVEQSSKRSRSRTSGKTAASKKKTTTKKKKTSSPRSRTPRKSGRAGAKT
ncbi:MAG: hypothetical protein ACYTGC_03475 [Planctomycetota bacterium]